MNETDLISLFIGKSPKEIVHSGAFYLLLLAVGGRAWRAWRNGGGLYGVRDAILFGTNVPKTLAGTDPGQNGGKVAAGAPPPTSTNQGEQQ